MFNLPKVKKTLTSLVSGKSIKKVVASVVLTAGLVVGAAAVPANSDAAISSAHYGSFVDQNSQIGALVLTPSSGELGRTAWHESHASHSSHASHASHYSHYSSRY